LTDDVSRNLRLAVATGAAFPELLSVVIATAAPTSVAEAVAVLSARASEIDSLLADEGRADARKPAELEPALRFEPELARVRPELSDHEIRGRLLYGEMVGRWSFFQVAIWAIAGRELSRSDADYVEQLGITTQLLDAQIWPMAVTRRLAASGAPLARSLVGAVSTLFTSRITVEPVAAFMRFLDRAAPHQGGELDRFVDELLARRETIPGVGRPVLGRDERVAQKLVLAERFGHRDGESLGLALAIERRLVEAKGLHLNAAGIQGALLRDLGFSPRQAAAICAIYFLVPALAQATFSAECASSTAPEPSDDRG
jgi:hypothetical protein